MTPELSVVVPILGYDSLGTFMQTLQVAWSGTIEVILLDSSPFGQRHDSVNYDSSGRSTVIRAIIDPPINFHATWNLGLRMARGQWVALVNDDILFGHKSIENCVQAIEKFDLPCVYPRHSRGPAQVELFEKEGRDISALPLEFVGPPEFLGFVSIFDRKALDIVGYYDEQFEMYCGDNDMWYRYIECGYPPRCVNNARIHHFGSRSTNIVKSDPANTKDFKAICEADRVLFRKKWGKVNAKHLLRQLKSEGGVPAWSAVKDQ